VAVELAIAPIRTTTHGQALAALVVLGAVVFAASRLPDVLGKLVGLAPRWVHGVCGRCGYSLRGLTTTVCPECGTDSRSVYPARRIGGRAMVWLVCAAWTAIVIGLHGLCRYQLDTYILRIFWGMKWYSASNMGGYRSFPGYWQVPPIRIALTVIVWVCGARAIYAIARGRQRPDAQPASGLPVAVSPSAQIHSD
jgi:hypothetical protein